MILYNLVTNMHHQLMDFVIICPSLRRHVLWYTNVRLSVRPFLMSYSNLRTPWPIHFKFHRVIGIDGLTVCILYTQAPKLVDNWISNSNTDINK